MNYNEYDSNGNKKSFDFSLLFTDKKYRSRLILCIYAIVFIVLIVMVRISSVNSNNQLTDKNENVNSEINSDNNENVFTDDNSIDNFKEEFSYIELNNYNFEYLLTSDEYQFVASGKRYNEKYDFNFTNQIDTMHYLSDGKKVMALEPNAEYYVITNFPYYYINYFDTEIIKQILNNSTKLSDDVYEITNDKLVEYVENDYKSDLNNKELTNTIKLSKKNNIIVSIEIDITNLINELGKENNSTIITLKYSNFNLIDDFEINF